MLKNLTNKIDAMSKENERQSEKHDRQFADLNSNMSKISESIEIISNRVAVNEATTNENKAAIATNSEAIKMNAASIKNNTDSTLTCQKSLNMILQKELQNRIEISGLIVQQPTDQQGIISTAIQMFGSFNIQIAPVDIRFAAVKYIPISKGNKSLKPIVILEFTELSTKIRVLQEKRKVKDHRNIFFDYALTPANRSLMAKAKKIAKVKHLKVYLNANKIFVRKDASTVQAIECDADLEVINNWQVNTNFPAPASSSQI